MALKLYCCYQLETQKIFAAEIVEKGTFSVVPFTNDLKAWDHLQCHERAPEPIVPPIVAKATSLLQALSDNEIVTYYSHENRIEGPVLLLNCYGFILHLIHVCNPQAHDDLLVHMKSLEEKGIPKSLDENRPSPYNFFQIFKGIYEERLKSSYWYGIDNIFTIKPEDILVYLEPGFVSPLQWDKQTQPVTHIMLVSDIISKDLGSITIKIIDFAHQPHNKVNDTRQKGGLGQAKLVIKSTGQHHVYTLEWGGKNTLKKELYAGRLMEDQY